VLAVVASAAFLMSQHGQPWMPALGASGAIMGMAGLYFIFFPVNRVFMVFWIRLGLLTGFRRFTKIWRMRGFWMLILWVGLNDVLPTLLGSRDHTAHWAHLGGFMGGAILAFVLLVARQTEARGADLLSLVLGKHAWALMGKPSARHDDVPAEILAAKAVDLNYRG
jgi:membrane associated rhomboid family serine protease